MDNQPKFSAGTVLVAEDDQLIQRLIEKTLNRGNFEVILSENGKIALERIIETPPDLVISDIMMPEMDGLTFLKEIRKNSKTAQIPVIMLTSKGTNEDIVDGLNFGADDYLPKPFDPEVLLARVKSKINRPPIPAEKLIFDRKTGLYTPQSFRAEAAREVLRSTKGGKPGFLAFLQILETERYRDRLGDYAEREISRTISAFLEENDMPLNVYGHDPSGLFLILMPEQDEPSCQKYLKAIVMRISQHTFKLQEESIHLTPMLGFASFENAKTLEDVYDRTQIALEYSASQLDLEPKVFNEEVRNIVEKLRRLSRLRVTSSKKDVFYQRTRTLFQFFISVILYLVFPFFIYLGLDALGVDITRYVYYLIVAALLITALVIWIEGFVSLKDVDPPANPDLKYPPASAIIAAYLPNEAYTIVDTINSFLELDYPGQLQIILAYNTPQTLPVEKTLQSLAEFDNRLLLLKVDKSESKSQNVNAAIASVTGEFVGIFDADHHPSKDAFKRAWQWLSGSCDIVQGHCLVRNYNASWISRMVAIEFESIYAVSHPGRTRLYGFGIFGGSNGYWKTDLLRQTRMHGFMLTEDIDSSMRVTEEGHIIVTDPKLISRELAPGTVSALWNQRMRWAQGWFQVSLEHFLNAIRSKKLTFRQKIGAAYLLAWREIYPWISAQMFPIIAFWIWKYNGAQHLNWLIPIFVLTTLFTLSVGPGQAFFAFLKAAPEIKQHKGWFLWYLLVSSLAYTEFKNIIARVAQLKEIMGERSWRITPRE